MKILIVTLFVCLVGCDPTSPTSSTSGVKSTSTKVATDASGRTVEQQNIIRRLKTDNTIGAIKHLYIISPYSGQVIIYSTVKGKVTSGGKRLAPYSVVAGHGPNVDSGESGFTVDFGGVMKRTPEVLQDDGTYGSSCKYVYWWDSQGRYHQHFFTGGQIIHISDQPIAVKNVIINMETG